MKKFYYLGTLIFVFILPSLVAGYLLSEYISLKPLTPFIFSVTIIGSIWDIWATRHGKRDRIWLWQFNKKETLGLNFLGLPFEEYLFYVASSVYVIFMWEGIKLMISTNLLNSYLIVLGLSVWTLFAIFLPFLFSPKGDRFIN